MPDSYWVNDQGEYLIDENGNYYFASECCCTGDCSHCVGQYPTTLDVTFPDCGFPIFGDCVWEGTKSLLFISSSEANGRCNYCYGLSIGPSNKCNYVLAGSHVSLTDITTLEAMHGDDSHNAHNSWKESFSDIDAVAFCSLTGSIPCLEVSTVPSCSTLTAPARSNHINCDQGGAEHECLDTFVTF